MVRDSGKPCSLKYVNANQLFLAYFYWYIPISYISFEHDVEKYTHSNMNVYTMHVQREASQYDSTTNITSFVI